MWYSTKQLTQMHEAFVARTHNLSEAEKVKAWEAELEESWERISACVLAFKAGPNILTGGRFDTLSLGTWMEIAKAVDITYVPIEMVGLVDLVPVLRDDMTPVELNIHGDMLNYRGMVRLDSCGCAALKAALSYRGGLDEAGPIRGATQAPDGRWLFAWDERTINGLLTYVGQIDRTGNTPAPIWWRPWVNALEIQVPRERSMGRGSDAWPLEWRVYVQGGKIAGISAYYIQAPVELTPTVREHLRGVIEQTNRVLAWMVEHTVQPWHPRYLDGRPADDASFCFDYISTPAGPAFLEAGPAVPVDEHNVPVVEWGAHPCYFMDRPVSGIALSRELVLPFDAL